MNNIIHKSNPICPRQNNNCYTVIVLIAIFSFQLMVKIYCILRTKKKKKNSVKFAQSIILPSSHRKTCLVSASRRFMLLTLSIETQMSGLPSLWQFI